MPVPESPVESIWTAIAADPATQIVVDMERLRVEVPAIGLDAPFPMEPSTQRRFLEGLDDIGITMQHDHKIADFEDRRPSWMPSAEVD